METLLLLIHIIVSVLLIIIVLLQSGKSADLAGAFGGYGSQSSFGPRGKASFLSKLTTTLAIMFMITSLVLWIHSARKTEKGGSVVEDSKQQVQQKQSPAKDNKPAPQPAPEKK